MSATSVCTRCGATASGAELVLWSSSVEGGETRWYCAACSRENIRSIEAKLDERHW